MKLVSYLNNGHDQLALFYDGYLYDMETLHPDMPGSMSMFLAYWEDAYPVAKAAEDAIRNGRISQARGIPFDQAQLLSPIPAPTSCRDGYAFRQHVEAARRNRGAAMIPEFDQYPIFYFTNQVICIC